jgi:hypothetical protein
MIMARSYYSTIFEQSADDVWTVIRDFNNYSVWVDGAGESHIESGKSGESVSAIRSVLYNGRRIRQKLLALSDVERSQTYEFAGEAPMPARRYQATLRVTPIIDGNRAFVEWWAAFDCESARYEELTAFFSAGFAQWLGSLRRHLDHQPSSETACGLATAHTK